MFTVSRIALFVARTAVTAWVGAAVLFVVVGVTEVTSPQFSLDVKDRLAVLRVPLFYTAGAILLTTAWCCVTLVAALPGARRRGWICSTLLTLSLLGMAADYQWVFLPLVKVVTPPGQTRTAEFETLHQRSSRVNTANLALCLVTMGLLNWPRKVDAPA